MDLYRLTRFQTPTLFPAEVKSLKNPGFGYIIDT